MDYLVHSMQYKGYSELIASAVENLILLHEEVVKNGHVVIGEESPPVARKTSTSASPPTRATSRRSGLTTASRQRVKGKTGMSPPKKEPTIPRIFLLDGIAESPPALAALPNDLWLAGQKIPLDRWVFGQYNKLFPAKASCRALAHLLTREPRGVPLESAVVEVAENAAVLGDFLKYLDKRNGSNRDNAFSTAFPTTEDSSNKGRQRYASQFVASVNTQKQVSGLLIDFKLVNYTDARNVTLQLTRVGWEFAAMANPILDRVGDTPSQKFSAGETVFLIDHILRSVPVEDFAYRTIMAAVCHGADTPENLDEALGEHIPQDTIRSLSKSFLSSQRSGAISRMADLGLVTRVRDGVRVSYAVTDAGREYLARER
jgi:hypothetical protein